MMDNSHTLSMKPSSAAIAVEDWGVMDYRTAWERQKKIVQGIQEGHEHERIVTVEHPHVFTLGFHGNAANLIASAERLKALGCEVVRIERGGDITYHGPGQLVVYPLVSLVKRRIGVKKYVELLERAVRDVLSDFNIVSSSNNEAIGVWLDWGGQQPRKICAIGVKISHGVAYHGLALNVNTNLDWFGMINPCGLTDKGVTSLAHELGRYVNMDLVKSKLSSRLTSLIGELNYYCN